MASTEADESPKQNGETTGEPTESKAAETTSAGNVVSAVDKTAETKDEKPEEKASKNDDENEKPEAEEEKGQQEKDKDDDSGQEEENDNVSLNTADSRTRGGDTTDDGRKDSVFGSHIPDHLDEDTLRGMKDYLQNCRDTTELDDDEITSMMIRLDRNVENRARYAADFHPLEEIVDDEKIRKEVYKEEEEYMVSHEFIKEMHVKLQKKKKKRGYPDKRTLNWVKRAAGFNRKDHHLAHAAIGGFDDDEDEDINDGGPKKIVPRRYTRGMARSTRMKKKEEFIFKDTIGLKSLLHCIKEMEPEQGPFPVPFECDAPKERHRRSRAHSDRKKKKRSRVASDDEEDDDDDDDSYIEGNKRSKARDRPSGPMVYPLVARFSEEDYNDGLARGDFLFGENRDILLIKITVDGEHVEEDDADSHTMHERKRELKRLRDRQYQKRKREQKLREQDRKSGSKYTTPIRSNSNKRQREDESHEDDERRQRRKSQKSRKSDGASRNLISARTGKNSISLALLDWQRRQMWSPNSGRRLAREDDQDISTKVAIPTQLAKCGIGYRLPPWESVNTASNMVEQSNYVEPPRGRHSDEIYAAWTHKLINCLNGSTRSWAIHEFFYSDIDRAWYDANPFVKDISKLGILPTTKLTRREWSVVRRMIPNRPRRFSKRFIFSQLRERNKYRDMVRELQQNPDQTNHTGYAIPAPIKVGATVTAFNKKYLILHRGTVLFYDAYSSRYLIQFERKELGTEFVSDTQVSSHGVPEILMPPAPSILTGAPEETALSNYIRVGELPYGTSFGPLSVAKNKDTVTCEKELATLLSKKQDKVSKLAEDREDRDELVEKVAERETLVTLMSIIDAATTRKTMLLDLMEKFNVLLVDRLPFGEGPPVNHVMSGYFEKHYAWLKANLDITNHCLDKALSYLQAMYGKAYSSTPVETKTKIESIKKLFVETMLEQDGSMYGGSASVTMPWVDALKHGSSEVGAFLSTLLCQDRIENGSGKENGANEIEACLANGNKQAASESSNVKVAPKGTSLRSRVAAAGSILSAVSYCCERASESDITAPDHSRPLRDIILASHLEKIEGSSISPEGSGKVDQSMLKLKGLAAKELKESIDLLSKELQANSVAKGINSEVSTN